MPLLSLLPSFPSSQSASLWPRRPSYNDLLCIRAMKLRTNSSKHTALHVNPCNGYNWWDSPNLDNLFMHSACSSLKLILIIFYWVTSSYSHRACNFTECTHGTPIQRIITQSSRRLLKMLLTIHMKWKYNLEMKYIWSLCIEFDEDTTSSSEKN